jgi:mortality factor 4-like protein 1
VTLTVPDPLKAELVDDWEYITKEKKLITLPRKVTVNDILAAYRDSVRPKRLATSAPNLASASSSPPPPDDSNPDSTSNANNNDSSTTSKNKTISIFSGSEAEIFDEVINGIRLYFDRGLGNILLYRNERSQYQSIKKKYAENTRMSDIYGPEHLLRLFVSFPALIAQTNMDQQSIAILRDHLEDFLRYLVENRSKLFLNKS